MKKTVLYLMNGFGVEQKDSFNIYNSNLMPNLDNYTKDYLFSAIETNAFDLKEGYRLFSTGSKYSLTYPFLDQFATKFDVNPNLKKVFEQMPKEIGIHLFVFFKNALVYEHLKSFLGYIKSKCENPVFLHLVLDSKSVDDYKEYEKIITKINYDLREYQVNTIVGKNILFNKSKDYVAILNHGIGEKWRETSKKFSSLQSLKTIPEDVYPFFVNEKFTFTSNDFLFFFNYEDFECTKFTENLAKFNQIQRTFSMFPLKGVLVPFFAYPTSQVCLSNTLKSLNANGVLMTDSEDMGDVNYYCNGLQNVLSNNVYFGKTDQNILAKKEHLEVIINDPQFDLVVMNDSIEKCKTIDELNGKLKQMDDSLKIIHDICKEKEYTLIVSSLYGINREFVKDNFTKCIVNFSRKVPVLIIDKVYTKDKFFIDFGDIYTLANTVYKNMDLSYNGTVLIKKKNALSKMVKK